MEGTRVRSVGLPVPPKRTVKDILVSEDYESLHSIVGNSIANPEKLTRSVMSSVFYALAGWDANISQEQITDFRLIEEAYRLATIRPENYYAHQTFLERLADALVEHGPNPAFFCSLRCALQRGGLMAEPVLSSAVLRFAGVLASRMCARAVLLTNWCDAAKGFVWEAHGGSGPAPHPYGSANE